MRDDTMFLLHKKITRISITVAIFSLFISSTNAIARPIDNIFYWSQEAYLYDENYLVNYEDFVRRQDGFDIYIRRSKQEDFSHIQVYNENPIELDDRKYVIKFRVLANNQFDLYFSIVTLNKSGERTFKDKRCTITGDGRWHRCHFEFEGEGAKHLLNFQLGYAPTGTLFKIGSITVEPVVEGPARQAPSPPSGLRIVQ